MIFGKINEYKSMKPGLERIEGFFCRSGIDFRKAKYVHIAGTNGKGSTARIMSQCLKASGYKTGLYISPHIVKINERIQIDSVNIKDFDLKKIDDKYSELAAECGLTFFEQITAYALIYFVQKKVDIAVLETGLGGRFDATNIITPLVSIITGIDFDHTEILGRSLQKIAFEKAGIIKAGVPAICGVMDDKAFNKISETAKHKKSKLYRFARDFSASSLSYDWRKMTQKIEYKGFVRNLKFDLSLLGEPQVYNCACALAACELLKEKGFKIKPALLKKNLRAIKWSARFETKNVKYAGKKIKFLIDGAHNLQAVSNFIDLYAKSPFSKEKTKLIFAVMREKDYKNIVKKISDVFEDVFLVDIKNERAVDNDILEKEFLKYKKPENIKKLCSIEECFRILKNNDVVAAAGSFYLAGAMLKFIEEKNG